MAPNVNNSTQRQSAMFPSYNSSGSYCSHCGQANTQSSVFGGSSAASQMSLRQRALMMLKLADQFERQGRSKRDMDGYRQIAYQMLAQDGATGSSSGVSGTDNNDIIQALLPILSALQNGNLGQVSGGQASGTGSTSKTEHVTEAFDGSKNFAAMDKDNSGDINFDEFLQYYVKEKENSTGKVFENTNSPEYAKTVQEAKNLFGAFANNVGVITKEQYQKILDYFDSADGKKGGKIDYNIMQRDLAKLRENGKDAIISGGKKLYELM